MTEASVSATATMRHSESLRKSVRLLVADDEELVRVGLKLILEKQGFEVVANCSSGVEAVGAALNYRPDLAILDLCLPGLNGVDAGREIHRVSPETRIILMGASSEPSYDVGLLKSGIVAYFHKLQTVESLIHLAWEVSRGAVYWCNSGLESATGGRSAHLSPRERQVLDLLAEGLTMKQIASSLHLSVKTIEAHRSNLRAKLGIGDLAGLVRFAIREGFVKA